MEIPRDKLVVDHRRLRLGKEHPRLRHPLRRGTAALRGESLRLCAAVPRADGKARRGKHRGTLPGHLHRAEDHLQKPPLHRRHRHRDLRLPAPALRPGGPRPLPRSAAGRSPRRRWSRWSTGSWRCRSEAACCCSPPSSGAARASTARSSGSCRPTASCGCASTARCTSWPKRSPSTRTRSTPSRWWSIAWWSRRGSRAGWPIRWRRPWASPDGIVRVENADSGEGQLFSDRYACVECGISFPEITPRMFSFNNPYGACPDCSGLGTRMYFDPELVVPDPALSLREGAIAPWENRTGVYYHAAARSAGRTTTTSICAPPFGSCRRKFAPCCSTVRERKRCASSTTRAAAGTSTTSPSRG